VEDNVFKILNEILINALKGQDKWSGRHSTLRVKGQVENVRF